MTKTQWQCEQPALAGFNVDLGEAAAVVLCQIADHRASLMATETDGVERMAQARQFGFASGRYCAHRAQALLGLTPQPVPREKRVPIWPAGSVGSITHSDQIAGAIASTSHHGVGLDIEALGRVEPSMYRILFNDAEQAAIAGQGRDADTIMFSAKEALYKAVYPTGQRFIGFKEVEVQLDTVQQTFTAHYLGDHTPNAALNRGTGYWIEHDGHVLTLFFIPRD